MFPVSSAAPRCSWTALAASTATVARMMISVITKVIVNDCRLTSVIDWLSSFCTAMQAIAANKLGSTM